MVQPLSTGLFCLLVALVPRACSYDCTLPFAEQRPVAPHQSTNHLALRRRLSRRARSLFPAKNHMQASSLITAFVPP